MTEVARIADQLERAWEGPAWHGPSVREVLKDVTAERAAARPLADAHSIWEIVLHLRTWEDAVCRRAGGEPVRQPTAEEDWPPVRATDRAAWDAALAELEQGHERLMRAIERLDDASLFAPVPEPRTRLYVLLHGIVQHDLYHAGQIALLRRG